MAVFLIVLDRATDAEREAVHQVVKKNATGWWHRFVDVWLATGHTASEWRDLVGSALRHRGSSVMVFRLPEEGKGRWAYRGPNARERLEWLKRNF